MWKSWSYRLAVPVVLLGAALGGLPVPAQAQSDHGFRFVRIRYESQGAGWRGRGGEMWAHDYPKAEMNFYEALNRTTRIHVEGPPLVLTLQDDRIFEYPVLYLCEPGFWVMEDPEVEKLREYLDRGGFILFDDFRGEREWTHFYEQIKRVFPDREPVEIPPDHPIWSIYFDIDPVAAPSMVSGRAFMPDEDRYLAFFDDDERMVALICYNQDIGDGWEWPENNLENASTLAFQMGLNFLIYALTH